MIITATVLKMPLNMRHSICAVSIAWFGFLILAELADERKAMSETSNIEQSLQWLQSHPLDTTALDRLAELVDTPEDHTQARKYFSMAAKHSLRDVTAQAHFIDDLISKKDYKSALTHIDAVLRQKNINTKSIISLVLALTSTEAGLQAITEVLATNPPWRENFMRTAAEDRSNAEPLYKILGDLHANQIQVFDSEIQLYLKSLVNHQDIETANFVWLDFLGASNLKRAKLLYDGDFSQTPRNLFFDWNLSPPVGVEIGLAPRSGQANNFALALDFSQSKPSQILVSQYLLLSTGNYTLHGEVNSAHIEGENDLQWEVRCMEKTSAIGIVQHRSEPDQWSRFEMSFAVPTNDCTYQKLILRPRGTSSSALNGQLYFDNFSLTQVNSNDG
jgi:hypothetical protein